MNTDDKKRTQPFCLCDGQICRCKHTPRTYDAYKQNLRREYLKSDLFLAGAIAVWVASVAFGGMLLLRGCR